MVQWKIVAFLFWSYLPNRGQFPLNHDYGRKSKHNLKKKNSLQWILEMVTIIPKAFPNPRLVDGLNPIWKICEPSNWIISTIFGVKSSLWRRYHIRHAKGHLFGPRKAANERVRPCLKPTKARVRGFRRMEWLLFACLVVCLNVWLLALLVGCLYSKKFVKKKLLSMAKFMPFEAHPKWQSNGRSIPKKPKTLVGFYQKIHIYIYMYIIWNYW